MTSLIYYQRLFFISISFVLPFLAFLLVWGIGPLSGDLRDSAVVAASSSYDWPTLAHDARRSGSTETGPVGPFTKIWYRDLFSELGEQVAYGYQPVAVHDVSHNKDLTYIGTGNGALYALDMDNGATFWRFPAPGLYIGGILSPPTVNGGKVYLGSLDGKVYALDGMALNGGVPSPQWIFDSGRLGGFWSTPAVTADAVYIGGRDGFFYAIDRSTGSMLWEYNVGAPILTSPAYDNGVLYFGAENMRAYALNAATGMLLWQSDQLAGHSMQGYYPVLTNDLVMLRSAVNDDPYKVLPEGEQLLADAAGCTSYPAAPNYDRSNAPCFDWKASAASQTDYDREMQAVTSYLSGTGYGGIPGRPQYETFYTLRRSDGQKPFVTPVLWTAGVGSPGVPPVVTMDGQIWTLYRSYFSDYDTPSWFIMGAFGQMNPNTGAISLRNPNPQPTGYSCNAQSCNPPFSTNLWMIGDESTAFSSAGGRLYTNQWSGLSIIDLATGSLQSVIGQRDSFASALTSGAPRRLSYGEQPFLATPFNGPPIFGDRIIVQYSSVVAVVRGQVSGITPTPLPSWTPQARLPFYASNVPSIAIPSQAELEPYVWEGPAVVGRDTNGSQDLQSELQAEIDTFLAEGRRAPWFLIPGKSIQFDYFVDPAQTAYYLSLAYPYLTPGQQTQIKSFVATEWSSTNPLTGRYQWNDGLNYSNGTVLADDTKLREYAVPGPWDYCRQIGGCEGFGGGNTNYLMVRQSFDRLYDLWTYANATNDWTWVQANWSSIKATRSSIDTSTDDGLLGLKTNPVGGNWTIADSANRRVAAFIGYTRMAYKLGDSTEASWGLNAATLAMQARLRYVNAFRPTDGDGSNPANSNWEDLDDPRGSGLFVQRFGWDATNIPQYRELVPEVSRLLYDYAQADVRRYSQFVDSNKPLLYLQIGPNSLEGEVMHNTPHTLQGIFLSKSLLSRLPGVALRKYADIAWVRQDYFDWERLARTIDAYGRPAVVDIRIPGAQPTILPTPGFNVFLTPIVK